MQMSSRLQNRNPRILASWDELRIESELDLEAIYHAERIGAGDYTVSRRLQVQWVNPDERDSHSVEFITGMEQIERDLRQMIHAAKLS